MSTIFSILVTIAILLFSGHFKMTLSPFSVQLSKWHIPLALLLIATGIIIIASDVYQRGKKEAYAEITERVDNIKKDKS